MTKELPDAVTPALAIPAGASFAKNPVPDDTVNPLFPAITKNF